MNRGNPDPYRLSRQWGVVHPEGSDASPLTFPFLGQRTADGTYLIVDRKLPENRLIEVSADGETVWSLSAPPRMNFAHRIDAETVLFCQGTDLYWADRSGRRTLHRPLPVTRAFNCGSVLGDRLLLAGDDGILLLTLDGRLLRHLRPSEDSFIEPSDVQLLPSGNILMSDALTCCAIELDEYGRRVQIFGQWRRPGLHHGRVGAPYSACRLHDGRTVVADWRGSRLAEFDSDGRWLRDLPGTGRGSTAGPSYVRQLPDGDLLVTETVHRRLLVRSIEGEVRWEYGPSTLADHTLSFPRTVEPLPASDGLLVCDTYADRIVAIDPSGAERWAFGEGAGLNLPRSARPGHDGRIALSDGLNGRVLVLDRTGRVTREVDKASSHGLPVRLMDPHYVELLPDGELLVVDSDLERVLLIGEDDTVLRQWGDGAERLSDPHQACLMADGGVLVADSANDRVIEFDAEGAVRHRIADTSAAGAKDRRPLLYPRFAMPMPDGSGALFVVDTDACRLTAATRSGERLWSVGPVLDIEALPAAVPELRVPKYAAFDGRGRILVADYLNSRIAELTAVPEDAEGAVDRRDS
ncbi:NHL repeat-containing protein [Streptomyces sp. NBC_01590]